MSKNKWVRSISFNHTNPDDVARLRLIGKKSFSRYIKGLLDAEIKRQSALSTDPTKPATPQPPQRVIASERKQEVRPVLNPMLRRK